jgi:hypothetical protein
VTINLVRQLVLAVAALIFFAAVIEGEWLVATGMGLTAFGMIASLWSTRVRPPQ